MSGEIAFDLRAASGSPTGVGRYLLSIVQALAEYRPDLRLRAYVRDEVPNLPSSVRVVRIASPSLLWHARTWWHLRHDPVRAYCSTSLIIPALTRQPCLPVILDVISFLYPQHHTLRTKLAERLLMRTVVRKHRLITESDTTTRDIARLFGSCRAVVVPPWVSPARPEPGDPQALAQLGVKAPYALYVGTVEPRKNVLTVVRAVASLRRNGSSVSLVLMGGRGWVNEETLAELAAAEADGTAVVTGYRPDNERDALFASASCLVLPSIYEGFGLPLLEAMERGLPCVVSTAPVFEEVAGDAALRVDPYDVPAWAVGIDSVLTDTALAQRLTEEGRRRALHYSTGATARAFESALAERI
jgi:glycosyltransferase involved in cell wall biosynthesis